MTEINNTSERLRCGFLLSDNGTANPPTSNVTDSGQPSFNYDLEIFTLCQHYINTKNHQGLALIARQKGLPPFLRFKIWPIVLKHHPFVLNPFIQPDSGSGLALQDLNEDKLKADIDKDLSKYLQRLSFSGPVDLSNNSEVGKDIFDILEDSIFRFVKKWGKIIKYNQALSWIALGLAEWFPPIPHTHWVLVGRDLKYHNSCVKNLFDDYTNYIHNIDGLDNYLHDLISDEEINNMNFHDVYERLVLVLLHTPEDSYKDKIISPSTINKKILPINGGTIEERVSFFIYCLRKLLPELSLYFQEEHILNKFGSHDDEWLIWWLKWCGSKVWSRLDRGRIWDLLFGWRMQNKKKSNEYYMEKMELTPEILDRLGPYTFWSVSDEKDEVMLSTYRRSSSFKDLIHELNTSQSSSSNSPTSTSPSNSLDNSPCHYGFESEQGAPIMDTSSSSSLVETSIPFSKLDPHVELIFVALALLKSKENTLMELDQHEIRQFLSRLPTKSLSLSAKYGLLIPDNDGKIISNDSVDNRKIDFMDNIINEAGELWRKWLWLEMIDDK